MQRRQSIHEGILEDRPFRGRMKAIAIRSEKLAQLPRLRAGVRIQSTRSYRPATGTPYLRAVNVKVRYHDRLAGRGHGMVRRLALYIAKEGPAFTRGQDRVDALGATAGWSSDRRVYHLIISPNDGDRIEDMRGYARRTMAAIERETGPLAWVAAVEEKPDRAHPSGNRHLHVLVRGVRGDRDILFDRRLVCERFREIARETATDLLGYLSERERRELDLQKERMAAERDRRRAMRRDRHREPDAETGL